MSVNISKVNREGRKGKQSGDEAYIKMMNSILPNLNIDQDTRQDIEKDK
jgi:hypothetical protein